MNNLAQFGKRLSVCLVISTLLTLVPQAQGAESCSRVAIVNYQEVLVDASSSNRGEGLRYYLQRDPEAKKLLDEYQNNNRPRWQSAALSTFGTAVTLAGFLRSNEGENEVITGRNTLILGGITMIAVSYLISRTNQYNNEWLLQRAIEEHNKRNTPRIFFSADPNRNQGTNFGLGVQKEF
ncbi:MAG: hypothetical protein ACLGG7_01545 [Bacteriovoracia bacterium]